MKVAFLLTGPNGGGAERVTINLANYLVNHTHHDVELLLATRADGPMLEVVDPRVRVVPLGATRARRMLLPLNSYVRASRPDVLVSHLMVCDLACLMGKALLRWPTKVLVTVGNHPIVVASNASRMSLERQWPRLIRRLYPHADCVIGVSTDVADSVARMLGRPPGDIEVIPNPVVAPGFDEQLAAEPDHPWFGDEGAPVVLAAGRFTAQKDFGTLLVAFAQVVRRRAARLIMIGDGEQRARLEASARDLGISEVVAMPGFVVNPYPWMRRSRLFVLSSRWEGFANVVAEALACGTPVVATDCRSGPAEILDGGRFGRLVPVGDCDLLADAIDGALDAAVDRQQLAVHGREFSVERIAPRYLERIEALAAR